MSIKDWLDTPIHPLSACFMLFLAVLVLKLCYVVNWSWWFVTAPIWIPFMFISTLLMFFAIDALSEYFFGKR